MSNYTLSAYINWTDWLALEAGPYKTYVHKLTAGENVHLAVSGGSKFRVAVTNDAIPVASGSLKVEKVIYDDNLKSYTYKNTGNHATLLLYYASAGDEAAVLTVNGTVFTGAPVLTEPQPDAYGYYNAEDYLPRDYKKDGSVEYTALLQEAINKHSKLWMPRAINAVNDNGLKFRSGTKIKLPIGCKFVKTATTSGHYEVINLQDVIGVIFYGRLIVDGDKDTHTGTTGEWGHGLSLRGASNVTFYGDVTLNKCWGDGFYVCQSASRSYCKDIVFKRKLTGNDNRRQGASVISVDGLDIAHAEFTNTGGTHPEAGICFEPNDSTGVLKRIRIGKLDTINNKGYGAHTYLNAVDKVVPDSVDIHIGEHNDVGSLSGYYLTGDSFVKGQITIDKANYSKSKSNAIFQRDTSGSNVQTWFKKLHVDAPNSGVVDAEYKHPIRIKSYTTGVPISGGLRVDELTTSNLPVGAQLIFARAINKTPFVNVTINHTEANQSKVMDAASALLLKNANIVMKSI